MPASIIDSNTTTPRKQKIRGVVRNATEQDWLNVNPRPDKGEIIYTSDTNTLKVGDGINKYSELPDVGGSGGGAVDSVNGKTGVVVLDASDVGALPDTTVIPTATSDLVNDSGFITGINSTDVTTALGYTPVDSADLATVATTGSYNDLSDKPYIPVGVIVDQVYDQNSQNAQAGIAVAQAISTKQDTIPDLSTIRSGAALGTTAVQPGSLATVATSGDYEDLINKPALGTAAYTNSTDYDSAGSAIAAEMAAKSYADSLGANYATAAQGAKADTALQSGDNVSDLVNDAGYITSISSSDVTTALGYTPVESITTGSTNGTLNVDGTDVSVYGLGTAAYTSSTDYDAAGSATAAETAAKNYADSLGANYATAAQGIKADTAVQSIWTGSTNGTINVDGVDVPVYGLGTAAYTSSTAYATSAQGGLADTAVQPGDLATVATTGAYSDLTGTPTIPTVGDGTITFTQGGVTKGTFTTNQSGNTTIALDAGGGSSLPSQTGHDGEFLTTDGTDPSWGVATAVTFREWGGNE